MRALASRMRVHARLRGEADHAGTTRRGERRDALAAAARLIVAADELAAPVDEFVTTAARILVEPNALTTVPADVRLWIDARAPEPAAVTRWREQLDAAARELAAQTRVEIVLETQSHSPGVRFDARVCEALGTAAGDGPAAPELVCFAGHDAGILAERIPAGMVLVRNRDGVSHAPEEHVEPRRRGGRGGDPAACAGDARVSTSTSAASATATVVAMVNTHSHAFQRDLRGVGERPAPAAHAADDFWTWRTAMFALAGRLEPETMHDVARRAYTEMVAAGYGAVGEFHYVHHRPDGRSYDQPNAMAHAVAEAATAEGLAIVLLPAAYHRNGFQDGADRPPEDGQRRFCDPDVETFLARVDDLRAWAETRPGVGVGIAAHSVRAVGASWLEAIAAHAERHGLVRHVHAHEQRRELDECRAEHGCTPIELLHRTGFLSERTTVVHGIHVSDGDIARLAETDTIVTTCPTTEGNLGDGHFPALRMRDAGVRMAIGSDSHVRIDPFEEVREARDRRAPRPRDALRPAGRDGRPVGRPVLGRTGQPRAR